MMSTTAGATVIRCPHCGTPNRVRPSNTGIPRCANCHLALPWAVSTGESGFDAEITASVPVVVDFWAPWCGPCRTISPALERLTARYAGRIKLIKVNVDDNPAIASRYGAQSIPLLVLIDHGHEVDRRVGAVPEAQLTTWLEPHLATAASDPDGG
jgi:thioredoxin 2